MSRAEAAGPKQDSKEELRRIWPLRGWIGLALIVSMWPANWLLPGFRTQILFAPLWLGYIFTVDALVLRWRGSSLWSRSRRELLLLFAASAPAWWLFELINQRTQNWRYLGRSHFTNTEYFILATICFATVIPAVFETAELVAGWKWVRALPRGRRIGANRRNRTILLFTGAAMLALLVAWPRWFYPFAWLSLVFLFEPLAWWRAGRSLLDRLADGDWRQIVALALGALICGFFWELWNLYSYPKWAYDVPGLNRFHLFAMPAPGYLGYLPFGLELYLIAEILLGRPPRIET